MLSGGVEGAGLRRGPTLDSPTTREKIGTRAFWKDPELNNADCATLVRIWADRHKMSGSFYDVREARAGDIMAFGAGWSDVTFGIYLDDGKIATTSRRPGCGGKMERKMTLVRIRLEGKPFIGGVHLG